VFDEQRSHVFLWVAAAVLLAAVAYRVLADRTPEPPPVTVNGASGARGATGARGARRAYVHVAGAVRRPGLYRLPHGARIATALELAGGPRPKADLTGVNLAARIEDGQQILVPRRGAAAAAATASGSATSSPAAGATAGPAARISLATATQAQLEALDGIGPALAQAILAYRDEHGGFRSIEELQEVDGIGEQRFAALREAVTL
jgi:competence protein ComEA